MCLILVVCNLFALCSIPLYRVSFSFFSYFTKKNLYLSFIQLLACIRDKKNYIAILYVFSFFFCGAFRVIFFTAFIYITLFIHGKEQVMLIQTDTLSKQNRDLKAIEF